MLLTSSPNSRNTPEQTRRSLIDSETPASAVSGISSRKNEKYQNKIITDRKVIYVAGVGDVANGEKYAQTN